MSHGEVTHAFLEKFVVCENLVERQSATDHVMEEGLAQRREHPQRH